MNDLINTYHTATREWGAGTTERDHLLYIGVLRGIIQEIVERERARWQAAHDLDEHIEKAYIDRLAPYLLAGGPHSSIPTRSRSAHATFTTETLEPVVLTAEAYLHHRATLPVYQGDTGPMRTVRETLRTMRNTIQVVEQRATS